MFTRLPKLLLAAALLIAPACVEPADDFTVESDSQEAIGWNAIGWNAIGWNALMTYPTVLRYLKDKPLNSWTYTSDTSGEARVLRSRILDSDTRVFMRYLVGCVLKKDDIVKWRDGTESETFRGVYGLCPQWQYGGITTDTACQERVSACLMMRNNAFGIPVMFSARGNGPGERPLETADPLMADGKDIASLRPCTRTTRGDGDCGWEPGLVGTCRPGRTVNFSSNSTSGNWQMVRVCNKPFGCDARDGNKITTRYQAPRRELRFGVRCPESGQISLMQRAYYTSQPTAISMRASGFGVKFPASEIDVFAWREGAFYGNMFQRVSVRTWLQITYDQNFTNALPSAPTVKKWYWTKATGWTDRRPAVPYTIYTDMYACQSPEWNTERARYELRICAGWSDNKQCAAVPTGNCASTLKYPSQQWVTTTRGRCDVEDSRNFLGDGDYDNCVDPSGKVWRNPLTSYLKDRCDGSDPQYADCALQ